MFFIRHGGRAALSHFKIGAALLIFLFNLRMNCSKIVSDRTYDSNHGSDRNTRDSDLDIDSRDTDRNMDTSELKFVAIVSGMNEVFC